VKLEAAIETESLRRCELTASLDRSTTTAEEKKQTESLLKECNGRTEALILLLLYYSAGMQNAEELEQHCDQ